MKSNYQKVWEGILIGYSLYTSKHLGIWALQIKQVVIASKLYVEKSKQGAKLLIKWHLDEILSLKKKASAGKSRPRRRPRKIISTEVTILLKNNMLTVVEEALNEK